MSKPKKKRKTAKVAKNAKINFRLPDEDAKLIECAAEALGVSTSAFVHVSAAAAARRTLRKEK